MGTLGFLLVLLSAAETQGPTKPTASLPANLALPSQNTPETTLAAVGDIRLDGPVGRLILRFGSEQPSAGIRDLLKADIVFGNLECPLTQRGEKQEKTWNFRAPPKNLSSLREAGFTILNLANNHTMDYGASGLLDTLEAVQKAGIISIGAGRNIREAERFKVIPSEGLNIGFLGLTATLPKEAWAQGNSPGVAYSDFSRFPALIRSARESCDVLVVSFHGGTELAPEPNEIQKAFAHAAVDAGADLVLGHHPHVLQALEVHRGKPILYSLGNFLFVSPSKESQTTVIAKARLGPGGVKAMEFVAVDTNWGQPKPADEQGRKAAYEALNRLGALEQFPERFKLIPH
jgi:poly-gamma-glutamate synthesis protein (capsule biosynthesis protein)